MVRNGQKKVLDRGSEGSNSYFAQRRSVRTSLQCVRLSVSKTGVHQAITEHVSEGIFCDRKRSGRPRKTSIRDDNLIRRMVVRSATSSTKKLQAALLQKDTRVTQMTISRRLSREFNLKSYKSTRKPRLTPVMKAKRLAFAKKHRDWTIQQWSKVLFSDESIFQQFVVRKRHVRRPPGKRYTGWPKSRYTVIKSRVWVQK